MSVIVNGIEYGPKIRIRIEDKTLGQLLKESRKQTKLSLEKVASEIKCSKSYLWEVEHDKTEPGLLMARKMSEAYGIPLATMAATLKESK